MKDAIIVFRQVYLNTQSYEACVAELKRKGFSRNDTIKVIMEVLKVNVVVADKFILDSLMWNE